MWLWSGDWQEVAHGARESVQAGIVLAWRGHQLLETGGDPEGRAQKEEKNQGEMGWEIQVEGEFQRE